MLRYEVQAAGKVQLNHFSQSGMACREAAFGSGPKGRPYLSRGRKAPVCIL